MPWPQRHTWDDNDLFPVLSTGAPQRPAREYKKARIGLFARPYRPTYATASAGVFPRASVCYRTEWANRRL
jgi:hypothetical protein